MLRADVERRPAVLLVRVAIKPSMIKVGPIFIDLEKAAQLSELALGFTLCFPIGMGKKLAESILKRSVGGIKKEKWLG